MAASPAAAASAPGAGTQQPAATQDLKVVLASNVGPSQNVHHLQSSSLFNAVAVLACLGECCIHWHIFRCHHVQVLREKSCKISCRQATTREANTTSTARECAGAAIMHDCFG